MKKIIGVIAVAGVLSAPIEAAAYDATSIVTAEAKRQGVPVSFALRIAKAESGVQCNRHNRKSTASGPLQILRGSARALGYRGNIRTASCELQTYYGMKHLAMCYNAAKGNQALAKACHQRGISVIYGRKKRR